MFYLEDLRRDAGQIVREPAHLFWTQGLYQDLALFFAGDGHREAEGALPVASHLAAAGMADDEARWQDDAAALQLHFGLHPAKEKLRGIHAHLVAGKVGHRKKGKKVGGVRQIAETDQRDVLRHAQPSFLQGDDGAQQEGVVGRKDGRRGQTFPQQLLGQPLARQGAVFALLDQPGIVRQPGLGQGDTIAHHPVRGCRGSRRPGQHRDPLVAQADQVADQRPRARDRIAHDGVHVPALDIAVDSDRRYPGASQLVQVLRVGITGGNDYPVHLLADDDVQVILLLCWVLVSVAEEHRIAAVLGGIFHAAGHSRPKGVGPIRDEEGQGVRPFRAQALGHAAGDVAQFLNCFQHPFTRGRLDVARVVQHARHGHG